MAREVKVVLISVPSIKGYSRWVWRVVECDAGQRGYLNERGVVVVWESRRLYRPHASRGKGPDAKRHAHEVALAHAVKVGLAYAA